jgi:hypothetical protein
MLILCAVLVSFFQFHLKQNIKEYFKFYNFERPYQSLVGKTPAEIYWGSEVARKAA